ncbi:hypothetical protein [Paenibacillus aceris]|uniref:Glutamine synthetase type III n=1 Tax=Paenibacillus aceris TaxID=869555 RepID=A0ABS4HX93_9BACL|nr:hypothetical protein [Paenibacillus aceris]MBP1963277.1 glutamine synthetase type III [Paenibacillus aceris]NHW36214.1 hypothetical protein [Paenibacillus aceris]
MTFVLATLKEDEYTELLDGIKDILKECYQITEDEAKLVIHEGSEKAQEYLNDYFPYIDSIREMVDGINDTLDKHMNLVFQEEELPNKMIYEAAAWHAFEYVRCYYKRAANFV